MEIILIKDIKGLGRQGDIKKVADGYAMNFLIPTKSAVPATKDNLAHWEKKRAALEEMRAKEKAEKEELAKKLSEMTVAVQVEAGESGKLFGSVTNADVAKLLSSSAGLELDKHDIELHEQIKTLGTYTAIVKLYPEVTAKVRVEVQGKQQGQQG